MTTLFNSNVLAQKDSLFLAHQARVRTELFNKVSTSPLSPSLSPTQSTLSHTSFVHRGVDAVNVSVPHMRPADVVGELERVIPFERVKDFSVAKHTGKWNGRYLYNGGNSQVIIQEWMTGGNTIVQLKEESFKLQGKIFDVCQNFPDAGVSMMEDALDILFPALVYDAAHLLEAEGIQQEIAWRICRFSPEDKYQRFYRHPLIIYPFDRMERKFKKTKDGALNGRITYYYQEKPKGYTPGIMLKVYWKKADGIWRLRIETTYHGRECVKTHVFPFLPGGSISNNLPSCELDLSRVPLPFTVMRLATEADLCKESGHPATKKSSEKFLYKKFRHEGRKLADKQGIRCPYEFLQPSKSGDEFDGYRFEELPTCIQMEHLRQFAKRLKSKDLLQDVPSLFRPIATNPIEGILQITSSVL